MPPEKSRGLINYKYKVEYRDRKTLEIGIEPPDNTMAIAPTNTKSEDILRIVKSKGKFHIETNTKEQEKFKIAMENWYKIMVSE